MVDGLGTPGGGGLFSRVASGTFTIDANLTGAGTETGVTTGPDRAMVAVARVTNVSSGDGKTFSVVSSHNTGGEVLAIRPIWNGFPAADEWGILFDSSVDDQLDVEWQLLELEQP